MVNFNHDKYFLASIVESSHDSIITINLEMEITSWNKAAEVLYGYTAEEAIGAKLTKLTLPKDLQRLLDKIEDIKRSKMIEVFESERVGKSGGHMILEVVVSPVKDETGEIIGVSTIARDLTSRRLAEKALQEKEMLQRLIIAQEDERSRISRDLHDELGQQLTALRFGIERLKNVNGDDRATESLDQITEVAENIDRSVDFLAWEPRPALLEGVGLAAAIENYVTQWSRHAQIAAEIYVSTLGSVRLPPKVEANLYRIMQEALNNARKHSGASKVDVLLERRADAIVLIISDNGSGFSINNKKKLANGMGLTGMKERAALIGGSFDIETRPHRGTTVLVTVPNAIRKKRRALAATSTTEWK